MTNNQSNNLRSKYPINTFHGTTQDELVEFILDRERQARISEHELLQHQATVNLKSAKAVAGWSELRVKQLKGDSDE